ncbi:MAG: tetratricopeptide repeat protein [Bacteroidales bacterium]
MDKNNLHKIFDHTECISTEKMIEYQEGKLNEKEKNSVEIHLASCQMCADEFEGLMLVPDKSNIEQTVFSLNTQVDEILAKTNKKIPFLMPINLMAAIILFLIGFTWYATYYLRLSQHKQQELAQAIDENYFKKDGEILILMPESALSESEKNLKRIKSDTPVKNLKPTENIANGISESKEIADVTSGENEELAVITEDSLERKKILADDNFDEITEKDKNLAAREEIAMNEDTKKKVAEGIQEENKELKNKTHAKKNELAKTNNSDFFEKGLIEFKQKKFEEAIRLFNKSINNQLHIDESYYYIALAYENLENFNEAISNYNKVIEIKKSNFYEEALWNKSQIQLKLENFKPAVNTLQQIKQLNGKYAPRATNLIDSLQNQNHK